MNLLAPINRLFYNSSNIQITGTKQAMIALFLQVGIERWRNYRDMFSDCYCRSSPYWANLNENLYRDSELVLRVKSNGFQYKGIIDNRTNLIEIFSLPKENTLDINNDIPVFNWAARYTSSKSELSALVFLYKIAVNVFTTHDEYDNIYTAWEGTTDFGFSNYIISLHEKSVRIKHHIKFIDIDVDYKDFFNIPQDDTLCNNLLRSIMSEVCNRSVFADTIYKALATLDTDN